MHLDRQDAISNRVVVNRAARIGMEPKPTTRMIALKHEQDNRTEPMTAEGDTHALGELKLAIHNQPH